MSNFSKRHFQDIDIKDLIHQYKQYECLWNFNCPSYKSKSLKQEAWHEIANYFQKDASEVKRKIKYLRSAYVAEKRKVVASKKSNSEPLYKPSLFYYNELDFLDSIVVLRKFGNDADNSVIDYETTNISPDTEDNEDLLHFEDEEEIDHKNTEISCKVETFAESELVLPSLKTKSTPKILSSRSLSSRPIKRKISEEANLNKSVSTNASSSACNPKVQCKNLYISFGKTIALQLQQIPMETAILAMSEIQTILTKKTLEHIKSLPKAKDSWSHSESEESCNEIEEYINDSS